MYMLVRLGGCVHVFDTLESRFVKSTFANFRQAMPARLNRRDKRDKRDSAEVKLDSCADILHAVYWVECKDPVCRFASCRAHNRRRKMAEQDGFILDEGHWIAE